MRNRKGVNPDGRNGEDEMGGVMVVENIIRIYVKKFYSQYKEKITQTQKDNNCMVFVL